MFLDERKIHRYLIMAIIIVHIIGLFVDIMDVDAAQYASIAQEMFKEGHWLQVQHRHADYLDKPPLLFWLSALSFKFLGISNFTYKLPSFLFAMIGLYSTYQLTRLFYGQRAGRIAAILLGTTQGFFSLTLDVRTDTILLGSVIFAIWQLVEYIRNQRYKNFILGFLGISLAMLAKGPIGIMVPVLAIGTDLVLRQRWKDLLKWQWLLGLILVGIMLAPMTYGLYEQFDKHPEVIVNNKTHVSGVYFYYWEQSFGRLTGENVWSNNTGPFYFVHTILWAFLPWTVVLLLALVDRIRSLPVFSKQLSQKYPEYLSIAGFVLPFIALSLSRYKLPHYIYVIFPLGAMLSAAYLDKIELRTEKILYKVQIFLLFGLWMVSFLLLFYIFTPVNIVVVGISLVLLAMTIWSLWKLPQKNAIIIATALGAIGANFVLSSFAYPRLLDYQSTSQVGKWLKAHPEELAHFSSFRAHMHAEDFYSGQIIDIKRKTSQLTPNDRFLYTDEKGLALLKKDHIPYLVMKEYENFNVTRLTLTFLNPKTRHKAIRKRYLVAIYPSE